MKNPIHWRRSLLWLLLLAPFFFISYNFANWWTEHYAHPHVFVFSWEKNIPFLPWTIIPYWSIDLLYGLSFLHCATTKNVDRHALRLLTAQMIAVICFLLFPLTFSFARPETSGFFGALFDILLGFDKPFNQAPSLHIALLVIIWARYGSSYASLCQAITQPIWRILAKTLVHLWAALIAISVLTTYQHHFIDVPSGALLGFVCLWLFPMEQTPPFKLWKISQEWQRKKLSIWYFIAAFIAFGVASFGNLWLLFIWLGIALLLVGLNYAGFGAAGFQKENGRQTLGAHVLFLPYTILALINSRIWTRKNRAAQEIMDGVFLGRMPHFTDAKDTRQFLAIVDLCAEIPTQKKAHCHYRFHPCLDLVAPNAKTLIDAANSIETLRKQAPTLVCCALGFSRSANAIAAWLLVSQRAKNVEEAIWMIKNKAPKIVLGKSSRAVLQEVLQKI